MARMNFKSYLMLLAPLGVWQALASPANFASQEQTVLEAQQEALVGNWHQGSGEDTAEQVVAKLTYAGVIPTVLRSLEPLFLLNVTWPRTHASADLGNLIRPIALRHPPDMYITTPPQAAGKPKPKPPVPVPVNNVITLSDPDAPAWWDPKWSEICHQIIYVRVNEDGMPANVSQPVKYKAPGPPPKTSRHRYVYVLWTPVNGTAEELHLSTPKDRVHWGYDGVREGVWRWAQENGLKPIAANFFYAQNKRQ